MGEREKAGEDDHCAEADVRQISPPPRDQSGANPDQARRQGARGASDGEREGNGKWFSNPDWYMVIFTGLLVFVGIVTIWFFYRQFGEMTTQTKILSTQAQQAASDSIESAKKVERQLRISEEQARTIQDGVAATRKAADAAKTAADISQRQVRAYVNLKMLPGGVNALHYEPKFKAIMANLAFVNSGQSPASHVVTLVGHIVDQYHASAADSCKNVSRVRKKGRWQLL